MSFTTALSGINAQSEKLNSAGNNIANSQTVGYKSSSVRFADVFANSQGIGVKVSDTRQNFSQGSIESTNRNLDLAISGSGFYRMEQSSGEVAYSRNGEFSLAANGDIVNAQGARLMGYGLDTQITEDTAEQLAFPFSDVLVGSDPVPLNVAANDIPARATSEANILLNLDATTVQGQGLSTVELNDGTELPYHFSNSFTAYDSLGNAINVSTYFERGADNLWNATAVTNGVQRGTFTLDFTTSGRLLTDADGNVTGVNGGDDSATITFPGGTDAEDVSFDLMFDGSTQFADISSRREFNQNGYTSGALVGVEVLADGTVMRNFSNEQSRPAGQIVLDTFRNEEGLRPLGNNLWAATNSSGVANTGAPGSGQYGQIESGAVEASNVDLAKELVDMIVSQRAYQANSNTISTQDELLQTVINL
ncbi:flagellar hook protein FlgE [Halomonas sp. SpR1]|uniref:flagellar hook protein FlgE n=1 Tax=Halomonas sp. SpR1 TaxID=3050462 RepID=UPI0027E53D97|nr:flagellar hook protein FlgE [Halomonas sp. SpR1]MDQ7733144.1 flagellar hook protein FlgE [Halomonas sp. SpR1]